MKKWFMIILSCICFSSHAFFLELPEEEGTRVHMPKNIDTSNIPPVKKYHPEESDEGFQEN